jgi:hypothetical protein
MAKNGNGETLTTELLDKFWPMSYAVHEVSAPGLPHIVHILTVREMHSLTVTHFLTAEGVE